MFIVHIAGHLGKDPETRFTPSGQKVTTFNMAVNQRKGKEDVTIWVRVTIWGDRFDKMLSYLKKGSAVIVTGRMNPPTSYTDKEGRTQISLDITAEMIEFSPFGKSDRMDGQGQTAAQNQNGGYAAANNEQYDQKQFQVSGSPYGQPNSSYGLQTGQGTNYAQAVDEDTLPF